MRRKRALRSLFGFLERASVVYLTSFPLQVAVLLVRETHTNWIEARAANALTPNKSTNTN